MYLTNITASSTRGTHALHKKSVKKGRREKSSKEMKSDACIYLNVVLSAADKMEWKVQSELEWFTEDPNVLARTLFFGSYRKKEKKDGDFHAYLVPVRPFFYGTFCFWREVASRAFSTQKNQQERAGLKEPFQTERYAGRLAPRH